MTKIKLVCGAAVLTLASVDTADARGKQPVLFQITNNTVGEVYEPQVRSQQGSSVTFVSDGDVMGPGTAPGHREVYRYEVETRTLTRITTTTDGESYDAGRESDDQHTKNPGIVPFISTGDLDPNGDNSDHNPELFFWLVDTGEIRQITDTAPPVEIAQPYPSDATKCIVYQSNGDLQDNDGSNPYEPGAGYTNPDGSYEIFNTRFLDNDFRESVTTQVSNGPAGTTSSDPVVGGFWFTRQCRSTAYISDHDQVGTGSTGVHVYNYTKTSAAIEQLSPIGNTINGRPGISSASNFARGPFVTYSSDTDPAGNGSTGFEVFRFRLFSNELVQFSFADPGESSNPVVSDGGGYIAFESTGELIDPTRRFFGTLSPPFNADGNREIFRADRKKKISQVTVSSGCENTDPTMRDTGRAIAFRSTCDLIPGRNPLGAPQIFVRVDVKKSDPLFTAAGCLVSEGCCNEANGCLPGVRGRKIIQRPTHMKPEAPSTQD